jgi:hypothetical protein
MASASFPSQPSSVCEVKPQIELALFERARVKAKGKK